MGNHPMQFIAECTNSIGYKKWVRVSAETESIAKELILANFPNWKVRYIDQLATNFKSQPSVVDVLHQY